MGKNSMFYLLLVLSLVSMGIGVFLAGFGVPIRETVFGAGLLVAGSVAIMGGFVVLGLAAAVAELQHVVQTLRARMPGLPRPARPPERKDSDKRPGPPRMPIPPRSIAEVLSQSPPNAESSSTPPSDEPESPPRKPRPEWLRRAMADLERPSANGPTDTRPVEQLAPPIAPLAAPESAPPEPTPPEPTRPEPTRPEPRMPPAHNLFDKIWPADRRGGVDGAPAKRVEAEPPRSTEPRSTEPRPAEPRPAELRPAESRPTESRPAWIAPSEAPPRSAESHSDGAPRDEEHGLSILKSGVIDEMAYTLFTDGSIEAQMPDGTMRFASIDELRRHIEQHER